MNLTPDSRPSQADDVRHRLIPAPKVILRRAAGYLELAELLVDGEAAAPPNSRRLLRRVLAELSQLDGADREHPTAALLEGEALRALGEWEAALPSLSRAAQSKPAPIEAWLGIGWCLKRLDRLDEAIHTLASGLEALPGQPVLHYNLACYHSLAGNVPAAIDHLTRAIAIDDRFRDLTGRERDFDAIRGDPRFVAATSVTV